MTSTHSGGPDPDVGGEDISGEDTEPDAGGAPADEGLGFGAIAMGLGFLTGEQLEEGLRLQRKMAGMGLPQSLGEILLRKGFLGRGQILEVLQTQGERSGIAIPGYRIATKLGSGAMGAVYKAIQISMERPVAIKVLDRRQARDETLRERFLREGRMAARLNHPNVVAAIDVGIAGEPPERGDYFLVMEYVDGPNLRERLVSDGPLEPERALEYMLQIARALAHAEKNGVIHRDVKPENILVGSAGIAKLADLGLARPRIRTSRLSTRRLVLGTPFYMSPEQGRGDESIDSRADVYSLAATFFHLLTGEPLFDAKSAAFVMARHLTEAPRAPSEVRPGLPAVIDRTLGPCLAKEVEGRPRPAQLVALLERARGRVSQTHTLPARDTVPPPLPRDPEPPPLQPDAEPPPLPRSDEGSGVGEDARSRRARSASSSRRRRIGRRRRR